MRPWRRPLTAAPVPSGLVRRSTIARPRAALAEQPVRVGDADDRQPVLGLGVPDRVAAGKDPAGLADLRRRPFEDRRMTPRGRSSGIAATDSANSTRPPIAKTSDSAFAAAISPNVRGSSTIGGKKSSVPMTATPARRGNRGVVGRVKAGDEARSARRPRTRAPSPASASASASAPSFAAQPPHSSARSGGSAAGFRDGHSGR